MALKNYYTVENRTVEYVPSGVKSPNSDEEMMVIKPYIRNQETGLYRAIAIKENWYGWVEFALPPPPPPSPPPSPTIEERAKHELSLLLSEYRQKLELVDEGLFTREELSLDTLKDQVRTKYWEVNR